MNAETRIPGYLATLTVLAISVGFLVWAHAYDERSRLVPVLVGWVLVGLAVLDVIVATGSRLGIYVNEFFTGQIVGEAVSKPQPKLMVRAVIAVLWVAAFVALVMVFGFFLVIPFYVLGFVVVQGKKTLSKGVWAAVGTTLFTYVVFEILLQYEVYRGWLFEG